MGPLVVRERVPYPGEVVRGLRAGVGEREKGAALVKVSSVRSARFSKGKDDIVAGLVSNGFDPFPTDLHEPFYTDIL